ncbi:MAG: hypothetical protein IT391_03350 [Nitrospira sp.]|nr:hypothetical protein [Nitrospira sp.]
MVIADLFRPMCKTLGFSKVTDSNDQQKQVEDQQKQFEQILKVANKIAKQNPQALPTFVRLLARKLQGQYMSAAFLRTASGGSAELEPGVVWFSEVAVLSGEGAMVYYLKKRLPSTRVLNLSTDVVLPWPWDLTRLEMCLSFIGTKQNPWKQDTGNHRVEYWLPFGIGWVRGGNHSIMTGILQGRQQLETDEVYDLSAIFPLVHCDGIAFRRTADNSVIAPVREVEFAAIYEVGRLMLLNGVSA